jgi:hypothetical protein
MPKPETRKVMESMPDPVKLLKRWLPALGLGLAALGGGVALWHSSVTANPPEAPVAAPVAPVPVAPTGAPATTTPGTTTPGTTTPGTTTIDGGVAAAEPPKTTATIVFTTSPATYARVMWGRKLLGTIGPKAPLVIVRPRDSGPLDVMITAGGYLPVQTRAHTFADNKVSVRLTTPEQKPSLWGYRQPLDAGAPLLPADQVAPIPGDVAATPL